MDFKKALTIHDSDFEDVVEIMKLKRDSEEIDKIRNLLFSINLIIDYYNNREEESMRIVVSYFPLCEEATQNLCEEFVCLKLGLYSDQKWKNEIANSLNRPFLHIPDSVRTDRQRRLVRDNYRFEKQMSEILNKSKDVKYDNRRSFIYSEYLSKCYSEYNLAQKTYNRKTVNQYWYLSNSIIGFEKFDRSACPLCLTPKTDTELYEFITQNNTQNYLQNIVVFPSKSADGNYSQNCGVFQKPYLDDFVEVESGLQNVFFFCFSRKPYRLRRLYDFKQRMKERLQFFDDKGTCEFISFSYEESLYLNGKEIPKVLQVNLGQGLTEIQLDYQNLLNDIITGLERNVLRLNEMSLGITTKSQNYYSSILAKDTEADETLLKEIFHINIELWQSEVEIKLRHFVFDSSIRVITGNYVSEELKMIFRDYLKESLGAKDVSFANFVELRGHLKDGRYINNVKQKKILVLSFRDDYTDSIFHKYPNSFDPYCVNPQQKIMVVSNYYLLGQHYEWGKYNYGKALRKILKSDFRMSEMRPNLVEYKRPIRKLPEDKFEEEMDRNSNRSVQQLQVTFKDGSKRLFVRTDWMLYKFKNTIDIAPLSDLLDLYESFDELKIQPLAPLVKSVLKNYVEQKNDRDIETERKFKEHGSYRLTIHEINSSLPLWKTLLQRKINNQSAETVYNEIMSHFNERYKVNFSSFKKWTDLDYGIPRSRKMQKYLIEDYLQIRPPYLNLIRRIKERTKNDTEAISIIIRHFLSMCLLSDNLHKVYKAISDDTKDLLDISSEQDVKDIFRKVKNLINYESVKLIQPVGIC